MNRFRSIKYMKNVLQPFFNVDDNSMYIAFNVFDRYISNDPDYILEPEIFTTACMMIATRVHALYPVSVKEIIRLFDSDKITSVKVVAAEKKIIDALHYQVPLKSILNHVKDAMKSKEHLSRDQIDLILKIIKYIVYDGLYLSMNQEHLAAEIVRFVMEDKNVAFEGIDGYFVNLVQKYSKNKNLLKHSFQSLVINCDTSSIPASLQHKQIINDKNILKNIKSAFRIGYGTYGEVMNIEYNRSSYAIKKIMIPKAKRKGITPDALREISCLIQCSHRNVIQIHAVYYDIDANCIYFLMDLMYDNLDRYVRKYAMTRYMQLSFISQLIMGLKYLHDNSIMHRDLSAGNILIRNSVLKIADFGFARPFSSTAHGSYSSDVCTIYFRAFELLTGKKCYNYTVDLWSCGCVIMYVLTGNYCFNGNNNDDVIHNIIKILGTPSQDYFMTETHWRNNYPYYERKGFEELVNGKTLLQTDMLNMIYGLVEYLPDKRLSLDKCLPIVESLKNIDNENI